MRRSIDDRLVDILYGLDEVALPYNDVSVIGDSQAYGFQLHVTTIPAVRPTPYNCGVAKRSADAGKQFTDAGLLEHIRSLPHSKATYKQLVKELRLQGEDRQGL